ncbi:RICIN domain-containing protein [Kitasatospora sp. NPDC101183]|uniref:RICIN domain-containing protein n=1 Tax=Kitasatospora sp. NPDC101183 TaxID=3364100 RepID=UPI00382E2965
MTGTSPRIRRSARRFLRPAGTALRIALATTILLVTAAVAASPATAGTQRLTEWNWNGWICDGYYLRMNTPTPNMVLEYDQASDNKAIYQRPWTEAPTQQWEACRSDNNPAQSDYIFRSKADNNCITLWHSYMAEGHWFSVDHCDGQIGDNQRFWISHDPGSGKLMLQVQHSKLWLAIQGDFAGNGSHVAQYANRATALTFTAI